MQRKNRKFWALLIAVVALTVLCAFAANAEVVGGDCGTNSSDVKWSYDTESKVLTIFGTGSMEKYIANKWNDYIAVIEKVVIGEGVTNIKESAFSSCSALVSVEISNSVESIGNFAFSRCPNLTSIEVGEGNSVFHSAGNCVIKTDSNTLVVGCKTSVIPNDGSVTEIGLGAFSNCTTLRSIVLPDCLTSIGASAFSGCIALESIEFPNSLIRIEERAFVDCKALTDVEIPDGVTSIGERVFQNCILLESFEVGKGNSVYHSAGNCIIETASGTLISGCRTSVIPDDGSVTSIGAYAFTGCSLLRSIVIPNGVTSIGFYAFVGTTLKTVDLPNSLTFIEQMAFFNSNMLEHVYTCKTQEEWESTVTVGTDNFRTTKLVYEAHESGETQEENRVESTCSQKGSYNEVVRCTKCNAVISNTPHEIDMIAHTFEAKAWKWASDYQSVTVTFCCVACGLEQTKSFDKSNAQFSEGRDGRTKNTTYTVTLVFNGQTFTKTKTLRDSFRCGMCDIYDEWHNAPKFGWLISFIHNFVHLAGLIGDRT